MYAAGGGTRRVRAVMTARPQSGPVRDPTLAVPEGRRPYRVAVRVEDRGRDRFPFEWARFTLAAEGRVVRGPVQTPLRRTSPGDRRSARATVLTFFVPRGFRPAQLRVRSAVAVWPFRGRWALAR